MIIAAEYSFNRGLSSIQEKWPYAIKELEGIINSVDARHYIAILNDLHDSSGLSSCASYSASICVHLRITL